MPLLESMKCCNRSLLILCNWIRKARKKLKCHYRYCAHFLFLFLLSILTAPTVVQRLPEELLDTETTSCLILPKKCDKYIDWRYKGYSVRTKPCQLIMALVYD